MKLEIKDISSSEVELSSWKAEASVDVFFTADIEIGEVSDERRDLFYVTVATPEALRMRASDGARVISERALLVVSEYTLKGLIEAISAIVSKCERSTWSDSVIALQRYFQYEYEDYKEEREG